MVVMDHWQGSGHEDLDMTGVESRFDSNIDLLRRKVPGVRIEKRKTPSAQGLVSLLAEGRAGSFDFIYVDGSHEAPEVLSDAVLAYRLLRVGGLIGFDDYGWRRFPDVNDNPKAAVDAFANVYWERVGLVSGGYQQFFKKNA
jgi:hypothetical protein